jgi:chorismate mutase/prephenate dehydratase
MSERQGKTIDTGSIREMISKLDGELIDILAQRAEYAEAIAAAKADAGAPVRDTAREEQVLRAAAERAAEVGLPADFVERLYQDLFKVSIERQRKQFDGVRSDELREATVAYLGGPGSYSHVASHDFFSHRGETMAPAPKRDFVSIFRAVENGETSYGVAPIENTTTGGINEVYDLLVDGRVKIVGELHLKVDHCLIGKMSGQGRITKVFGHPQALAQSRRYLMSHPEMAPHYVSSTTRALERLLEEDDTAAAIGGSAAARMFGMDILARGVGDHEQNFTRFIVIARDDARPSRAVECKTSLVFTTLDKPGCLVDALTGFRDQALNLVKLESRPIAGNPWEELFIMDVDGHVGDPRMAAAMEVMQAHTREVRVLGCYARDRIEPTKLDDTGAK